MISLRPARPDDIPGLAELGFSAWKRGILPLVTSEVVRRLEGDNPFIPFLREQGGRILVAEWNGALAGLGGREHADNHISDIWVSPDHEGRGVGSALIRALEEDIRAAGFTEATISVAAENTRAFGLYRHLGYVDTWRGRAYDPILGVTLEKVALHKDL
ncbi:GNAT family N-acetyltransferase [Ciceribacter sp. L1K23]|uniref:GNAT family N-acetyltransferase n=1 Tax=Ciceribacter sp. L1K23 TaxID=2820276 RepID=UPI001B83ED9F|nr:N-acetyltransferase [Ciceribacter sp. L1K23]MBR0556514.1 GNAT family N-acetyltransferase [Ciceribacter sp. L1K23]